MSSHPKKKKSVLLRQVAAHRKIICTRNVILGNGPTIGGWLLIRVAAHSRFHCTSQVNSLNKQILLEFTCQININSELYSVWFCKIIINTNSTHNIGFAVDYIFIEQVLNSVIQHWPCVLSFKYICNMSTAIIRPFTAGTIPIQQNLMFTAERVN